MLDQPLAYKLLGQLALGLTLGETLLVALGIEVATRVGSVYLIDEIYLAVALAKLILGVYQYQSVLGAISCPRAKSLRV